MKVGACQTPDIREDPAAALRWMEACAEKAEIERVDLLCFPECFLQGYPSEEMGARNNSIDLASSTFNILIGRLAGARPTIVFGLIEVFQGRLFNTAVVVDQGRLIGRCRKSQLLSGERYFEPGSEFPVFEARGVKFGINICFDTAFPEPAAALAQQGAAVLVCPANNMMMCQTATKWKDLHNEVRGQRARETGLWVVSADVTGERDGRISYGPTAIIDPTGRVSSQVPLLELGMAVWELEERLR